MPRTVAPTSAWGRFTRRAGATRKRSGNIRPGSRPNRTNPKRWRHCGNCRASIRLKGRQYLEPGDGLGPGVLNGLNARIDQGDFKQNQTGATTALKTYEIPNP